MRKMFLAVAVAAIGGAAAASCGGGGSSNNNSNDMGGGSTTDLAMSGGPSDMTSAKLNCLAIGYCLAMCTSDVQTCFTMCSKNATKASSDKFVAAFNCGQSYCDPDPDSGMTGSCVEVKDPTGQGDPLLCDPGLDYATCAMGGPSNCNTCLDNAVGAPLLGDGTTPPTGACTDETAPSCRGGTMCAAMFQACTSDT